MNDSRSEALPEGMEYGEQGLYVRGVVARDIATHLVMPRPNRSFAACIFDWLGSQTMLGMHLARIEPAGIKCDHRHLDETIAFMVTGRGVTEFRQDDDAPLQRVEWGPGDLLVIPTNAYHRHVNTDDQGYARQLSFRNAQIMNSLLHGTASRYGVYNQKGARFPNRFADEPDYFTLREQVGPNRVRTNFVKQIADDPLPPDDPSLGEGTAILHYSMGGQRMLDVSLVGIAGGGFVRPHCPLAEESFFVLRGRGSTDLWSQAGAFRSVSWGPGDLVSPPLGVWRQHRANGDGDVRLLRVRNIALGRALGGDEGPTLDTAPIPDRFPNLLEPGAKGEQVPRCNDEVLPGTERR
jgi:cupin superfamily acireductone dioxygenase involved in methionine salvage